MRSPRLQVFVCLLAILCLPLNGCGGGGAVGSSTIPTATPTPYEFLAGGDWPTFAHDMQRTARAPASVAVKQTNVSQLQLKWTYQSSAPFLASPIEYGGLVYVVDYDGQLTALKASTGSVVWQDQIGLYTIMTPAIYDGILFVGIHDYPSQITALDPETGNQLWQQTVPGALNGSPVALNGVLYVGVALGDPGFCHPGGVYAFNERTGIPGQTWLTEPGVQSDGGGVWAPLSVYGQNILYGTGNTCVNSPPDANAIISMSQGMTTQWVIQTAQPLDDDDVGGGIMINGSNGYVMTKEGSVYSIVLASGQVNWSKNIANGDGLGGIATPAITENTVIVSGGYDTFPNGSNTPGGTLYGLSTAGSVEWSIHSGFPVPGYVVTTPDLAFAELDNSIAALNPTTGKALWSYTTQGDFHGSPVLTSDGLFVADLSGTLYAFDLPAKIGSSTASRTTLPVAIKGQSRYRPFIPKYCTLDHASN